MSTALAQAIDNQAISLDAERAVLGSLLIDPRAINRIAAFLRPEDFTASIHAEIYAATLALAADQVPTDIIAVADRWENRSETVSPIAYLSGLAADVPTSLNVEHYAHIVEREGILRQIRDAGERLGQSRSPETAVSEAEQMLTEARARLGRDIGNESWAELVQRVYEELAGEHDPERDGVTTGLHDLDEMIGGLRRGEMTVIAARPSIGKTSLATTMAWQLAVHAGVPVAFFSLEMTREAIAQKILSLQADVAFKRLRSHAWLPGDAPAIKKAAEQVGAAPIHCLGPERRDVESLVAEAWRLQQQEGIGLVIIDYLQMMETSRRRENRQQEVGQISREIKTMARTMKVPVLLLCQLNRQPEQRANGEPTLADLRDCVTGDTLVIDGDSGKRLRVDQLVGGSVIVGVNAEHKTIPVRVEDAWSVGDRPVFRLTTQSGRVIRATSNHPFLTPNGWKPLEELTEESVIASVRRYASRTRPFLGLPPELCRLLGYFAGNGSALRHRGLSFITSDEGVFEDAKAIVTRRFPAVSQLRKSHPEGYFEAAFSRTYENGHGKPHGNPLREWFRAEGVFGERDREKHVADAVFLSGKRGAAEFLAGYFATDGCVKKSSNKADPSWRAQFDTTSLVLAHDVQDLLLRIGVASAISPPGWNSKSTVPIYRVAVTGGGENLAALAVALSGVPGSKGARLQEMAHDVVGRRTRASALSLPPVYSSHLAQINPDWRDQGKALTRSVALAEGKRLRDPVLTLAAESDVLWEKIRSIEPDGVEEVFDLRVPQTGSFMANGIVVHNSGQIEQDADVVLLLFRGQGYDPTNVRPVETIAAKVGKNRLGECGIAMLGYRGDRMRFVNSAASYEGGYSSDSEAPF